MCMITHNLVWMGILYMLECPTPPISPWALIFFRWQKQVSVLLIVINFLFHQSTCTNMEIIYIYIFFKYDQETFKVWLPELMKCRRQIFLLMKVSSCSFIQWKQKMCASPWDCGTYHIGDQRRLRPAHPRSLARAFAIRTHEVWK